MPEMDYTKRKIEAHNLYSSHLSEDRTIKVYLPPGYNPDENVYPVMYCHDGLEFFTHGRIATLANQLMAEQKLGPIIIVGIAVQMSTRRDDYDPSGRRHKAYSQFVLDECMPFVEQQYAVDGNRESRFMAGISLGAATTLSMYVQRPNRFRKVLLFSGAFYEQVQKLVEDEEDLSALSAYMVVGQQETAVETPNGEIDIYHLNHNMRDTLEQRHANVSYSEASGKHIWGFWQSQIPSSLEWVNAQLNSENRVV